MIDPATTTGVVFSQAAAVRIKSAVKRLEGMRNAPPEQFNPSPNEQMCWGMIGGCDVVGQRYSWFRVYPDLSKDSFDVEIVDTRTKWRLADPIVINEHAMEANGRRGIATGTIVLMTFAGYHADGFPAFVFQHTPYADPFTTLPLHDHRNNVTGGGFAWATFAPGTQCPSQPWFIY